MRKPDNRFFLCELFSILVFAVLIATPINSANSEDQIQLKSRMLSLPDLSIKELKTAMDSVTEKRLYTVLQFSSPLTLTDHALLKERGVSLYRHLGGNAYDASVPKSLDLEDNQLKLLIQGGQMLSSNDKIEPKILSEKIEDWALDKETNKIKVLVKFYPDVDPNSASRDLQGLGLKGELYGPNNTWAVEADIDKVKLLGKLDRVWSIEEGPIPFFPLNNGGRRVSETNEAQQANFSAPQPAYDKVSGQGVQVGICDSGVDENHNDFSTITASGTAGATRVYNQRSGSGSHGTHVASIAAGNGFNSTNNGLPAFSLRGHGPRADVGDYPGFGGNAQLFHDAIVNDGTDVSNHSYVQSMTVYDDTAEALDIIVRGDGSDNTGDPIPARPQVWAAGNNGISAQYGNEEGYYAVFTSAKNTISVGSIDTVTGRLSNYSSLGPTFDGRIKPDIVAPGCGESVDFPGQSIQAASNNTQGYIGKCGTSMAAPVVTGIAGLMMEQYQQTFGIAPNIRPSTYKAMLVHSARDMVKTEAHPNLEFNNPDTNSTVLYHAGPDFTTGYGLVDAEGARDLMTKSAHWKESSISSTGHTHTWCVAVAEGSDELKIVLAWDDEPGSTTTSETTSKLVNDLDLQLVSPSGKIHLPWTLDPLPLTSNPGDGAQDPIQPGDVNPAYRGVDHRNNVEMANVHLPKKGTWFVKIKGYNLPTGNSQPYSLVSSHRFIPFCYIIPPFDICDRLPWICKPRVFDPIISKLPEDVWVIDPRVPIPVDEICKYVLDCPGCDGSGWAYCPGWRMGIEGLPRNAKITLFNDQGKLITTQVGTAGKADLLLRRQRPGDRYYIALSDRSGKPYGKPIKVKLRIKSLTF
jgi:subtilisin family serine protease